MAQLIDVYQPTLPVLKAQTASDEFTLPVLWAISVKNQVCPIADQHEYWNRWVYHHSREARSLLVPRNELLPYFLAADKARLCIVHEQYAGCDHDLAVDLVGSMLLRVGAKGNDERFEGIIELIENDRRAIATGLWEPLHATIATVAMTCDAVIANHKMAHLLTPAEFAAAHRKARYAVMSAKHSLEKLTDFIRKCDAVLLDFDFDNWCEPYLLPQYQATGQRMLELHSYNDDEDFVALVEQTVFGIPSLNWRPELAELPKS